MSEREDRSAGREKEEEKKRAQNEDDLRRPSEGSGVDDDSSDTNIQVVNDAESSGSDGEVIVNQGQNTDRNIIYEQFDEESKGEHESERNMADPQNNKDKTDSSVSTIKEKE